MPLAPQREPVSFPSNEFYGFIELVEGANTIMISATNSSGRTSSSSITVYYHDTVPPSIWVIYPSYSDYTTPFETITVSTNIDDYSTPTVTINGIQATVTKNDYSSSYTATAAIKLVKGINDITIIAKDSAGNTSTATKRISFYIPDTTAPVISITSPAAGSSVNSTQVTVTGTIDDDKAYVKVNGNYAFLENDSFRKTIILPNEGANAIVVTATDSAGNKTTSTITVYRDTTPPSVTFTIPAFNTTGVSRDSNISINFSEAIKASTITTSTFTLNSEMGFVSGTVTYDGNTATFKPAYPLNSNTIFTATIKGGSGGINDLAGNSLATDYAWVFKTGVGAVGVDIIEPSSGAIINKATALVKGTITAQTPDVGIRVNGIIAEINGTNWVAQVPLQIGQNMIEATATDSLGNMDKKSITINTQTIEQPVKITINQTSGIAPLNATFTIDTSISNRIFSYRIDFDGDGVTDLETTTGNITNTYNTSGIYYPTVTVTDNQGNTYTETTTINVLDRTQMDALLKSKWEGMKGALINGDTTTGAAYIFDSQRSKYKEVFDSLKDQLQAIFSQTEDFVLVFVSDNRAEFENIVVEDGTAYSYPVIFVKDENGLWKIRQF